MMLAACSGPPPQQQTQKPAEPAAPKVAISQFYPASPRVAKGESTQLCYGVDGAKAVRLAPAVEEVWPAMSRCFDVKPAHTTTYTLTADDGAGHSVSKTATIEVGGAPTTARGAAAARMIQDVTVSKLEVAHGEQVTICYTARNAASVKVTPGQGGQLTAERGCITDRPAQTTTYQVLATGASGQTDAEKVTVKVR
jgi:hypothetical protein